MANDTAFIKKLKTIVLENYSDEQFGVSDLVERIGISRSQLHRKLKSATGQSISQFIREIRLDKALEFLQNEDTTASEVAYKVGFNSPTYFNTCFNEYFGYPPGETQLQMELVKSNNNSERITHSEERKFSKNKRVLIWLFSITMVVAALFIYKYTAYEKETLTAPSVENEKSIAVLPLKNWSGDLGLEYVSDGMTDEIISKLSQIRDIDYVIPFTSILPYKGTNKDIQTIAKELGVAYILEGNFKLSGGQFQSNVKLIEVSSNEHLWTFEYSGDWKVDNIFGMQAAVAENVANKMKVRITKNESEIIRTIITKNELAYQSYLKATFQFEKYSLEGFKKATYFYEQAISLDSSFVDPYIGLSRNFYKSGLIWGGMSQKLAGESAKKYYLEAMRRDEVSPLDYSDDLDALKMAIGFQYEWDLELANAALELMQKDGEYDPDALMSAMDISRKLGYFDLALRFLKEAQKSRSLDPDYASLASCYYLLGEDSLAMNILRENDPFNKESFFYLMESSKIYYYLKAYDKSKVQLDEFKKQFPERPPLILSLLAVHAKEAGNTFLVNENLQKLENDYSQNTSGSPAWFIAMYYCHTKEYDKAFAWLRKSYDHHEVEMMWLKEEPMLRPLRSDPRYIKLYKETGFLKLSPISLYKE